MPARRAVAPLAKSQAIVQLAGEREHVRAPAGPQQHGRIDLLGGGVGLGLVQHVAERAENLREHRHRGLIHR